MVGPLKGGSHKKKYLLVMVDKFTKWIEAKPVKTAESGPVIEFRSGDVKTWCANPGIKLDYASVYHPQTNGQVE